MKARKKRIIVSVSNDLVSDNRVHKVCTSLERMGFSPVLVGRLLLLNSETIHRNYATKRFRLFFNKGAAFYAEYNIRLFLYLLFTKADVLLSNDMDTLAANFIASKLKNTPLVFDSHEYFSEVPELVHRPRIQKVWQLLESQMLPKIKHAYTVCASIAQIYNSKYGTNFKVLRNVPFYRDILPVKSDSEGKTILYQGAVNVGRGLKQAILAMHYLPNARLIIAGDGDCKHELEQLVLKEKLQHKVKFTGRIPLEKLGDITLTADLGLSIEEDMGLNYRFALPNKLFDYIQARVPVLVSKLPEMKAIVENYKVGQIAPSLEPQKLATKIEESLYDLQKRELWQKNLPIAAKQLCWEKEEKILEAVFEKFL